MSLYIISDLMVCLFASFFNYLLPQLPSSSTAFVLFSVRQLCFSLFVIFLVCLLPWSSSYSPVFIPGWSFLSLPTSSSTSLILVFFSFLYFAYVLDRLLIHLSVYLHGWTFFLFLPISSTSLLVVFFSLVVIFPRERCFSIHGKCGSSSCLFSSNVLLIVVLRDGPYMTWSYKLGFFATPCLNAPLFRFVFRLIIYIHLYTPYILFLLFILFVYFWVYFYLQFALFYLVIIFYFIFISLFLFCFIAMICFGFLGIVVSGLMTDVGVFCSPLSL